eukprot:c14211_g1_i2 orf=112-1689(+)
MNWQGYWRLAATPTISVSKSVASLCSCFLLRLSAAPSPRSLAALSASSHHGPLLSPALGCRGLCWVRRTPPFPRRVAASAALVAEKKHLPLTGITPLEEALCDAAKSPVSSSLTVDHGNGNFAAAPAFNVDASEGVRSVNVYTLGSPCDVNVAIPCNVNLNVADGSGCLCNINVDGPSAVDRLISTGSSETTAVAAISTAPQGPLHPVAAPPSACNPSDSTQSSSKSPQLRRMLNSNHAVIKDHMDTETQWFPYLNQFMVKDKVLTSTQIMQMLGPFMVQDRKDRIRRVVANRTYAVCPVVEGLLDLGNIAAVFRSADALGFQSVHVISNESDKRYKKNRKISMGSEKWLDAELFQGTEDCFEELRSRGYRVAVASVTDDSVPISDMDWTIPTAVVFGNEYRGVSMEALQLADFGCYIPMEGMVDSFNVSVAAGIVMHHAVNDRKARLGKHGDLSEEEQGILSADFYLRHSSRSLSIIDRLLQIKQEERQTNLRSVLTGDLELDIELPEYLKVDLGKVCSEFNPL